MKSTRIAAGLLAAAILVPAASYASSAGPYVELNMGASLPMDQSFNNDLVPNAKVSYDPAFALTFAGGYAFGNGFRADLEYGYQEPKFNKITGTVAATPITFTGSGASVALHTFTANGYYDINTGTAIKPFVGGGIGVASAVVDASQPAGAIVYLTSSASDTLFAYQATVGASYALTDNVSLVGSYRYLGTTDGNFKTTVVVTGVGSATGNVKTSFGSNVLRAGLRYSF